MLTEYEIELLKEYRHDKIKKIIMYIFIFLFVVLICMYLSFNKKDNHSIHEVSLIACTSKNEIKNLPSSEMSIEKDIQKNKKNEKINSQQSKNTKNKTDKRKKRNQNKKSYQTITKNFYFKDGYNMNTIRTAVKQFIKGHGGNGQGIAIKDKNNITIGMKAIVKIKKK